MINLLYKEYVENANIDNAIISNLLEIIGEDIAILNEERYIPPFEKMLNLMMPIEEKKIKVSIISIKILKKIILFDYNE